MKKEIICLCVCCCFLSGCFLDSPLARRCFDSFYSLPEHPQLTVQTDDDGAVHLVLGYDGMEGIYPPDDMYYAVCDEFGDDHFGRITGQHMSGVRAGLGYTAVYPYPIEIEITSDTDWDGGHPDGTSLGDCFAVSYFTMADYVDHNYDDGFYDSIFEKRSKPLSELSADDLRMMRIGSAVRIVDGKTRSSEVAKLRLTPVVRPQAWSVHRLTVVWTMNDGTECVSEVEVAFP